MSTSSSSQILIDRKSMVRGFYKIIVVNLANAVRDHENGNFVSDRFDAMLSDLKDLQPDILVFLEWGRWPVDTHGFKLTPGKIVDRVDEELGLSFYTATRANASTLALGKAVFYRPFSIWIDSADSKMVTTSGWGSDILILKVAPVQNGKIRSTDQFGGTFVETTSIGIVHAPVPPISRSLFYDALLKMGLFNLSIESTDCQVDKLAIAQPDESKDFHMNNPWIDLPPVLIGDFNTFGDCPAASRFLTQFGEHYQELTPPGSTFKAYPYDSAKVVVSKYDPAIHVGERLDDIEIEGKLYAQFIPESMLDHVFISRTTLKPVNIECDLHEWKQQGKNGLPPSDHKIIDVTIGY